MRIAPPPASRTRSISAGSGSRISDGWWAPHRLVDSQGPSRWMPASRPPRTSSANPATWRSNSAGPAVTSEATSVVVPCLRCNATAVAVSAATRRRSSPLPRRADGCRRSPGTTVTAPRSRSAGRGAAPAPTASHGAVRHLNPPGPQQFSARQQGVGGQQHSDALPFRLGAVGLAVVVDELKPARRGVVEQHRHVRVMLQDGRRPQRADRRPRPDGARLRPCADRSPPGSRAGPP